MLGHRKWHKGGASVTSSSFQQNVKPIMDLSELRMSRDTDQQSIIWNEITAARRKLEEENQLLRDKLHEAQMANRLLRLKLKQQQAAWASSSSASSPAVSGGRGGIGNCHHNAINVERELKNIAREAGALSKVFPRQSRKDAFRNPAAPGKKRFQVSSVPKQETSSNRFEVFTTAPPEFSFTKHVPTPSADARSQPTSGSDKTPPTVISIPVASSPPEGRPSSSRELVVITPTAAAPAPVQLSRRRTPLNMSSIRRQHQQTTESTSTVPHGNRATASSAVPSRGSSTSDNLPLLLCQGNDQANQRPEKSPKRGSGNPTGSPQHQSSMISSSVVDRLVATRICSDDDDDDGYLALDYVEAEDNNYNYLPPSVVAPPLGEENSLAWDPSDDHYRDWYLGDE